METRWSQLWELESGKMLVPRLEMADTLWKQTVGLIGRSGLPADSGLWIAPCNSIHTFAMGFPIDVLFLDKEGSAMRLVPMLVPWRVCAVLGAKAVVELPAGTLARYQIKTGMRFLVTKLTSPNFPPAR